MKRCRSYYTYARMKAFGEKRGDIHVLYVYPNLQVQKVIDNCNFFFFFLSSLRELSQLHIL